jgi:hypothetical protein
MTPYINSTSKTPKTPALEPSPADHFILFRHNLREEEVTLRRNTRSLSEITQHWACGNVAYSSKDGRREQYTELIRGLSDHLKTKWRVGEQKDIDG